MTGRAPGAPAAGARHPGLYPYVAAGGALGAVLRWRAAPWVGSWAGAGFPWGTLLVNATGSLLIGFLVRYVPQRAARPRVRAFLAVGLCGGYTTFSTFAAESVALGTGGRVPAALAYAAGSVLLCLAATFAGIGLGEGAARLHPIAHGE